MAYMGRNMKEKADFTIEVYERVGKSVISVKTGLSAAFYGYKKSQENFLVQRLY